mgnify:CR=1 FL=1
MATNPSLVSVETAKGKFQQTVSVGKHVFLADEHESFGGTQSRDLGDPKTIGDFAEIVQSPERLKLLEIAEKCPVHRTLENRIDIHTLEVRE